MSKLFTALLTIPLSLISTMAFALDADGPPVRDQGFTQTLVMVAIALVFFYFILWRPEQKRRKTMEKQRDALKKGDRITAMGIIGTIVRVQEHTIIVKMFDGSKIEMLKGAITEVLSGTEEDAKKADKIEKIEKEE